MTNKKFLTLAEAKKGYYYEFEEGVYKYAKDCKWTLIENGKVLIDGAHWVHWEKQGIYKYRKDGKRTLIENGKVLIDIVDETMKNKMTNSFKKFFTSSSCCNRSSAWKPDIKTYNLIINDENKANFLYRTSQEKLQSTIDGYSSLKKKIIIFLYYLLFVMTVIAGFIIKNSSVEQVVPFNLQLTIIFYLFSVSAIVLANTLKPRKFFYKGNNPENIFDEDYFSATYSQMIVGEAILYKERIDHNQSIINKVTYLFNRLLIINITLPAILIIIMAKIK